MKIRLKIMALAFFCVILLAFSMVLFLNSIDHPIVLICNVIVLCLCFIAWDEMDKERKNNE